MTQSVIRQLPEDLINQIAAGEVVERPASVIKELIENSLDSGASQIEVSLVAGGLDEIRVLDNGCGIFPLDLPLSVQRHATSKIKTANDLEAIGTFGFRGEALSSICSVAQVTLISRTHSDSTGYQITLDQGVARGPIQMVAAPVGTQVIVTGLFKTIPARRKFLRSNHTELTHCQKLLKEITLANPGVRFTLRNENRLLGTWVTSNRRERFQESLKVSWEPIEIRETRDDMILEAYLSPPEQSVARSDLFLFINGRPVRHRPFLSAIRTAFFEVLGPGREPVGTCYLDLRKDWVDVNVHPQKWEVRCFHQESIYSWLLATFRKHLTRWTPSSSMPSNPSVNQFRMPSPHFSPVSSSANTLTSYPFNFLFKNERFLICEDDAGLIISQLNLLEPQAETSRLLRLWNQGSWPIEGIPVPVVCRPPEKQRGWVENSHSFLKSWGFQTEGFGDGDFTLRTRPTFISEAHVAHVFLEFISKWSDTLCFEEGVSNTELIISWLVKRSFEFSESQPSPTLNQLLGELEQQMQTPRKNGQVIYQRIFYEPTK